MATTITKTIGATSSPTTPDYSTLQSWEDALPANLVSADELHVGECLNQGVFSSTSTLLTIGGQTTDSTRYVHLKCATGASFADNASVRSNALYYNESNGVAVSFTDTGTGGTAAIIVSTNYTRITGLQIKNIGSGSQKGISVSGTNVLVDSCLIDRQGGGTYNSQNVSGNGTTVVNSLLYNDRYLVDHNISFFGCTLRRLANSHVIDTYSSPTFKNCALFNGDGSDMDGKNTGTYNYCATNASSFPAGANNTTSLTLANQFENSSTDFRAKSTGGLQAGTPDSTNTPDDITGLARDATTPWIGCWEVAGAAASNVKIPLLRSRAVHRASFY